MTDDPPDEPVTRPSAGRAAAAVVSWFVIGLGVLVAGVPITSRVPPSTPPALALLVAGTPSLLLVVAATLLMIRGRALVPFTLLTVAGVVGLPLTLIQMGLRQLT